MIRRQCGKTWEWSYETIGLVATARTNGPGGWS